MLLVTCYWLLVCVSLHRVTHETSLLDRVLKSFYPLGFLEYLT